MSKLSPTVSETGIDILFSEGWKEYQVVFGMNPMPVLIIDKVDKIVYCNMAAVKQLFANTKKFIGVKWFEALRPSQWNEHFPKNGQSFQKQLYSIIETWIETENNAPGKWLINIQSLGIYDHKILYFNPINDEYSFFQESKTNYSAISDSKGIIRWASKKMFELFKTRMLHGRNIHNILLLSQEELHDLLENNSITVKKQRIRSRDVYFEISARKSESFEDLLEWNINDITDRIQSEENEDYTSQVIHKALEMSNEAIAIHDTISILYHNEKFESFLGNVKTKKVSIYDIIAPEYTEIVRNRLTKAASGQELPFIPMRIRNFNTGEYIWVETKPVFLFRNKKYNKPVYKIMIRKPDEKAPLVDVQQEVLRLEQELDTEKKEKNIIIKRNQDLLNETGILKRELHHRVKNNSQIITSLIKRLIDQPVVNQYDLEALRSRINVMSVIHDLFYKERIFNNINIFDTIQEIIVQFKLLNINSPDFNYNVKNTMIGDSYLYSIDFSLSLGLIYNELLLFCNNQSKVNQIKFNIFVKSFVAKLKVLSLELFVEEAESTKLISEAFINSEHFELIKIICSQIDGKTYMTNGNQIFGIEINF